MTIHRSRFDGELSSDAREAFARDGVIVVEDFVPPRHVKR